MKEYSLSGDSLDLRLSVSYLLAYVVNQLWPNVKFGLCEMTQDGFFYDFDLGEASISEKDFGRIEAEMKQMIANNCNRDIILQPSSIEQVIAWAQDQEQTYLLSYFTNLKHKEGICFIKYNEFALPVIRDQDDKNSNLSGITDQNLNFKIIKVGGAYWQSQANQAQLQRLRVVVFATDAELQTYLQQQTQQTDLDHRQIGKRQNLFMFSDLVGAGLPLLQEDGAIIRRQLEELIVKEETRRGYAHVYTPDIAQLSLYETSGHYPYYKDSMYPPLEIDGKKFMLRPMTCPHHFQIYKQRPYSFRELPVRLAELAKLYRHEQSGELSGLVRVRTFTLADAHIICRADQVENELKSVIQLIEDMATIFNLKKYEHYSYRLSLGNRKDEKKYFKDDQAWQQAENILRRVLEARGDEFVEAADEAAFYGPKIDVQMRSQNGKEETACTVQYDFVMPKRFDLTYIDSENQRREAVVIHRSSIGAIERLMAFLIEFYEGRFPIWLSPCQLRILTVNTEQELLDYARHLEQQALDAQIRVKVDRSQSSVGKKIRQSQVDAMPYVLVLGKQELQQGKFTIQVRSDLRNIGFAESQLYSFTEILENIQRNITEKV